jgi:hypothetical protein
MQRVDRVNQPDWTNYDGYTWTQPGVVVDSSGNKFILTYQNYPYATTNHIVWIYKVNPDGTEIDRVEFTPPGGWTGQGEPQDLAVDRDDNLYVSTREQSDAGVFTLMKLDGGDLSNILWQTRFPNAINLLGKIAFDNDNNAYVITKETSLVPVYGNSLMVKLNGATGAVITCKKVSRTFGSMGTTAAWYPQIHINSSAIYLYGWQNEHIVKLNLNLEYQWSKTLEGYGDWSYWNGIVPVWQGETIFGMSVTDDAIFMAAYDFYGKFDLDGNRIWFASQVPPSDYWDQDQQNPQYYPGWTDPGPIQATPDGGCWTFLTINYSDAGNNDMFPGNKTGVSLTKYDANGSMEYSYFLNQDWGTPEFIAAAGGIGNCWYDVFATDYNIDRSAGVDSSRITFTMMSHNEWDSPVPPDMGAGMDTGFTVSLSSDGQAAGTVTIPLQWTGELTQSVTYTLRDNTAELVPHPLFTDLRFVTALDYAVDSYTIVSEPGTMSVSYPVFTYLHQPIRYFDFSAATLTVPPYSHRLVL